MERWSPPPCMVCSSFCPTKLFSLFPRPPHPRRVSGRLAPVLNFPARRRASFPPQFMGRTIGYLRDRTVTRRESTIFAMSDGASASPPHSKSASDTVVTTSDDQQQEDSNYDNSYLINTTAPRKNREETVKALDNLLTGQRPTPCDVFGSGPLLLSDIPSECLPENGGKPVVMGIDEAGRGPVLGPMIYGAAFWAKDVDASIIPKDFNDSKQLSAEKRDELFEKIKSIPNIGFVVRVLHASEISRSMLRKDPYNLNAMSHDAAMQMIRAVLDAGVKIDTCYVDTVGIAGAYQSKLEREFNGHGIRFVVEKKADANYAPCSAGSVVAKVSRDVMTAKWKYSEPNFEPIGGNDFGSGYPSDPKCKEWMEKNLGHPIFGYPDFARFSWAPMKKTMDEEGITMRWEADDDEEDDPQQMSLNAFVVPKKSNYGSKQPKRKRARLGYHEKLGLTAVTELVVS